MKRTDEEILAARVRAKRRRLYGSVIVAIVSCILFAFYRTRYSYRPLAQIPSRLPLSALLGVSFACLFYYSRSRRNRTMICPKCEETKVDDGISDCSCGGHFEDIETMKEVV